MKRASKWICESGRRWITLGIRREDKSVWESRAPLSPSQVGALKNGLGVSVVVQPSRTRVFTDNEYLMEGGRLSENLEDCDVIVGVKEVPTSAIIAGKTYFCFSHTHKGQPYNMPILKKFIDSKCTLVDYELLTDDSGRRLVAFGKYAGYAGMINALHGMGVQLLERGVRTPFLNVALSHIYPSLASARSALALVGDEIEKHGLPHDLNPLLLIFTGKGNVSQGAQEIASELPIKFIKPEQVQGLQDSFGGRAIYGCVLEASDYCQHRDKAAFDIKEYMDHPERYSSCFHTKFAPKATAVINGIYWETKYPRLLTTDQAEALVKDASSKLVTIADISCDIKGSIEITDKAAKIEDPFIYFGPEKRKLQIMSVDNLPAQLPRDATEYFGSKLLPIIKGLAREGTKEQHVARATITSGGQLGQRHQWLQAHLATAEKKRVLVLGSGFVAGPVVKHLGARSDIEITLASDKRLEAEKVASLAAHGAQVEILDINDKGKLDSLVARSNVVISLIPATMHLPVAQACLNHSKHLVTASYISPQMEELDGQAKAKKVTFLNEIGLDPGLDHLSAKQMIDSVHSEGTKVVGFTSWCGGLPAPECADNPLGYKFSWSPRGVLLAALNDARYRLEGKTIQVKGSELLAAARSRPFKSPLALEGIPNRDSLKYLDLYGLPHAQTMLRGTLRYEGFSSLMRAFRALGLFSLDPLPEDLARCRVWADLTTKLTNNQKISEAASSASIPVSRLTESLHWLGMFSSSEAFTPAPTLLDSFCNLLQKKLQYAPKERDMVVMQHGFILESDNGERQLWGSSLIEYGHPEGFSAMARTVGYPVAVAAEMILDGQIQDHGVLAPLSAKIYNPMLKKLQAVAGIRFHETRNLLTT